MRSTNLKTLSVVLSIFVLWLSACGGGSSSNPPITNEPITYKYTALSNTNDGWQVGDLNTLGIDPSSLENLINKIQDQQAGYLHIDSITIAHNGQLLLDHRIRTQLDVADGWANNQNIDLHVLNSVTKSITSALIGIAIDRGEISNVDVPVHDYFTHKQPIANWNDDKAAITLEHWLNMQSGYEWDEWNVNYLDPSNLNAQMNNAADPIQFLLDRPMTGEPGDSFAYSTGITFGIGRILQIASGMSVAEYLQTHLLTPLNINTLDYWSLDNQLHTGSALYLTARDTAKIGQLFLDNGQWNGNQVISQSWVNQSTQLRVPLNQEGSFGYGYQWWMLSFSVNDVEYPSYYASGFGGQFIFNIPDLNLVIVLTGSAYEDGQNEERDIIEILENEVIPNFVF